jgi:hypothetical protein
MAVSETFFVMILTHAKWSGFTTRQIPNARESAQVMIALSRDSRTAVDAIVVAAKKAGGGADPNPVQDLGFMYSRGFEDPDGHIWEAVWMNPQAAAS